MSDTSSAPANGLMPFAGNAALDAEAAAALAAKTPPASSQLATNLAAYVDRCYQAAKWNRETGSGGETMQSRLLKCARLRKGEYDAATLAKIQQAGGATNYENIIERTAISAESWITEYRVAAQDEKRIQPTPLPDLPADAQKDVAQKAMQEYSDAAQAATAQGAPPPAPSDVYKRAIELRKAAMDDLQKTAAEASDAMWRLMSDQMAEGNWEKSLDDCIVDFCTYPFAVRKGPIARMRRRASWQGGQLVVNDVSSVEWERVSPFDFYWSPNATNVNDGYVCERMHLPRRELSRLRKMDGYSATEIDALLSEVSDTGLADTQTGDTERAALEDRSAAVGSGSPEGTIEAIEFWGPVTGKQMKEWRQESGMDGDGGFTDDNESYDVQCIKSGGHVIFAMLNPDPLEERPYSVFSFYQTPGSIVGKSIPEILESTQKVVNPTTRALVNNLAWSSGPILWGDASMLPKGVSPVKFPQPWNMMWFDGSKNYGGGRAPMGVFPVPNRSAELIGVIKFFDDRGDNKSMIPRYIMGDASVGGAGATASGLHMLMGAAAKGIRNAIGHVDQGDIIPQLQRLYRRNLRYSEDPSVKGDCRVVASGALALIAKEDARKEQGAFMDRLSQNQVAMQIVGLKGFARVLRAVGSDLHIPIDEIVPSDADIEAKVKADAAAQAQAMQMQLAAQAQGQDVPPGATPPPAVAGGQAGGPP